MTRIQPSRHRWQRDAGGLVVDSGYRVNSESSFMRFCRQCPQKRFFIGVDGREPMGRLLQAARKKTPAGYPDRGSNEKSLTCSAFQQT